jgi:hypothetical protein
VTVPSSQADHEVIAGRTARVGGLDIVRVLPTRGRRTVGAWCFVDLMGPDDAIRPDPMEVGPHPHIGLSTVTWLLDGQAVHHDSLGTEQTLLPGQLNLMTAGRGIVHAELSKPDERFRGVQLWVAQPEATRSGDHAFEHHGELPEIDLGGGVGRLLVGELLGAVAPTRADTPLIGVEVTGGGLAEVPLDPAFEHCVVPLDDEVAVGEQVAGVGDIVLLGTGREEVRVDAHEGDRWLLLGGAPLGEDVRMWWNFVARTQDEITEAYEAWQARDTERFGDVAAPIARIDAPRPPWLR